MRLIVRRSHDFNEPPGTLDNPDPEYGELFSVDAFEAKDPSPELIEKSYQLARRMAGLSIENSTDKD